MPRRSSPALTFVLSLAVAGLGGATGFSLLGRLHWFFDLFTNFPLQIGTALTLLSIATLLLRRWRLALLSLLFLVPHLVALSYYFPAREFPEEASDLRVLSFNVLTSNRAFDPVHDYLVASDADLILLMETDRTWVAALAPLEARYPHVLKAPRGDNFGMTFYSRRPISSHEFHRLEGSGVPCLRVTLSVEGEPITVVCAHPLPPVGGRTAAARNAYLRSVTALVQQSDLPTIVLGDLNATVWSPRCRDFLAATGLHDTGRKRGFQSTWHRGHPLFALPIDHIFHSSDLTCTRREIGPPLGSDHRPVVADLALPAK